MQRRKPNHAHKQFLSSPRMILWALVVMAPWLNARPTTVYELPSFKVDLPDHRTEARYDLKCDGDCATSQRSYDISHLRETAMHESLKLYSPPKEEEFRGSCRLLAAGKAVVKKVYGNRAYGGGYCGIGVGKIINGAGFPTAQTGRHAINYENYILREQGWKKLPIEVKYPPGKLDWKKVKAAQDEAIKKAPPGSVLVFSGGCTPGHFKPYKTSCARDGDRLGHVTMKGDDGFFYTDGRTKEPSTANRFLVGVWVPPGTDEESCHRPYM